MQFLNSPERFISSVSLAALGNAELPPQEPWIPTDADSDWISIEPEPERPDIDLFLEALAEEAIRDYEDDIRLGILNGNQYD